MNKELEDVTEKIMERGGRDGVGEGLRKES